MDQLSTPVIDLDAIIDSEARGEGRAQQESSIGRPRTFRTVARLERANFLERTSIPNIYVPRQVSESRNAQ